LDRINGDSCVWEQELKRLAEDDNLMAFVHDGFWQPMDTLRDKIYLEKLWGQNKAQWKTWS
jgi:glucose-1-phosphate cytidylyltransferase